MVGVTTGSYNHIKEPKFREYFEASKLPVNDFIIKEYTFLVRGIAKGLLTRLPVHIDKDDLISAGMIGLLDAIKKYNPSKNIEFEFYASFRIKGAMLDELRSMDWVPRSVRKYNKKVEKARVDFIRDFKREPDSEEIADKMETSLEEYYSRNTGEASFLKNFIDYTHEDVSDKFRENSPLEKVCFEESRNIISHYINKLPKNEKTVVALYYYNELTMKEIADIMGYNKSRISQLHTKALNRLRTKIEIVDDVSGDVKSSLGKKIITPAPLDTMNMDRQLNMIKDSLNVFSVKEILNMAGISEPTFYKKIKGMEIKRYGKKYCFNYELADALSPIKKGRPRKKKINKDEGKENFLQVSKICDMAGISEPTFYKKIQDMEIKRHGKKYCFNYELADALRLKKRGRHKKRAIQNSISSFSK